MLVTGGMVKPDKVLSTEWDLVYVPECNELSVAEWETLGRRIRAMAGEACGWCCLISAGFLNMKPIFIAITFEERVTRCDI